MLTKDLAICIRAVDYSETSQIVTFFTRATGKLGAIAKGSKRPKSSFDGPIEIFSHGKIVFSDSTREKLATLTEFQQQPDFTSLAADLYALNCCLFASELIDRLTDEHDPHPHLFDHLLSLLRNASRTKDRSKLMALLVLFQLGLLKEIGLQPVLNTCSNCKKDFPPNQPKGYFSSSANGLVCRDCEQSFPDKITMAAPAANCLTNLRTIAHSNEDTLRQVEKVLIYHFTELLNRPPKMAKYILNG